ncbi:hypothetical protein ACFPK9_02910 [Rubritalea spongiae]|uniref:Uncharacterized protein n=1 Tax=Rubritalea spongiae TaxID=430797 RepID=A0ABW5E3U6_9BACT
MDLERKKLRLLLKDCTDGFYQQMFFLGKDVIHPAGNQLLEYGFTKSPSKGLKGTSCYSLETENHTIELYGSCAAIYTKSSKTVFIRKKNRFYKWLPAEKLIAGQWTDDDLETLAPADLLDAMTPLLKWWLEYEAWIVERLGQPYREQCYQDWKKVKSRPAWLPPSLATQWVEALLEKKAQHTRPKLFAMAS